jgi:hypothetical protein
MGTRIDLAMTRDIFPYAKRESKSNQKQCCINADILSIPDLVPVKICRPGKNATVNWANRLMAVISTQNAIAPAMK